MEAGLTQLVIDTVESRAAFPLDRVVSNTILLNQAL